MMCFLCRNSLRRKIARVAMTHVQDDLHNDNRPLGSRFNRNVDIMYKHTRVSDCHKKIDIITNVLRIENKQKTTLNNMIYEFKKILKE